eukprot:7741303-Pyramimonas_sp.AAC.1
MPGGLHQPRLRAEAAETRHLVPLLPALCTENAAGFANGANVSIPPARVPDEVSSAYRAQPSANACPVPKRHGSEHVGIPSVLEGRWRPLHTQAPHVLSPCEVRQGPG